jgi:hypothetical protein
VARPALNPYLRVDWSTTKLTKLQRAHRYVSLPAEAEVLFRQVDLVPVPLHVGSHSSLGGCCCNKRSTGAAAQLILHSLQTCTAVEVVATAQLAEYWYSLTCFRHAASLVKHVSSSCALHLRRVLIAQVNDMQGLCRGITPVHVML